MSDTTVRVQHLRNARLCMAGSRRWFEAHGLSWNAFLDHGIAASTLRAFGDPLADRAVAQAEMEQAGGR